MRRTEPKVGATQHLRPQAVRGVEVMTDGEAKLVEVASRQHLVAGTAAITPPALRVRCHPLREHRRVTWLALRFISFAVINLRRDSHPQACALAGWKKKARQSRAFSASLRLASVVGHDQINATILGHVGRRIVGYHRLRLAITSGAQTRCVDTLADQVVHHRPGTLVG